MNIQGNFLNFVFYLSKVIISLGGHIMICGFSLTIYILHMLTSKTQLSLSTLCINLKNVTMKS